MIGYVWRWWKTLCWFGRWLRCKIRRRHGEPLHMGRAPVRSRNARGPRVEVAAKVVCSECFAPLDVRTNRAWRRAIFKP